MLYDSYRLIRFVLMRSSDFIFQIISHLLLKINKVGLGDGFRSHGLPAVSIQGTFKIGQGFTMNNNSSSNPIGRSSRCLFVVRKGAELTIGDNVGMSGTSIVCQKRITIADNVKIGGNVCIYDTDFHSLDPNERSQNQRDQENTAKKDVYIEENVFIGAHTTILKGVKIGKDSIVGACSVVSKSIPQGEIWAGNPARFIRKIEHGAK